MFPEAKRGEAPRPALRPLHQAAAQPPLMRPPRLLQWAGPCPPAATTSGPAPLAAPGKGDRQAGGMSALEWFAHKALGGGIYWIQERFYESGNRANIWLVRGSQRDVVIDTGLGLRSLPDYLRAAGLLEAGADDEAAGGGRRPLLAVATHVHFDHAGGLHQFAEVAVHGAEAGALQRGDNYEAVTWLSDREVVRPPGPGWTARSFRVPPVQPTHVLQEGAYGPARPAGRQGRRCGWRACPPGCGGAEKGSVRLVDDGESTWVGCQPPRIALESAGVGCKPPGDCYPGEKPEGMR